MCWVHITLYQAGRSYQLTFILVIKTKWSEIFLNEKISKNILGHLSLSWKNGKNFPLQFSSDLKTRAFLQLA